MMHPTLADIRTDLAHGDTTSRILIEEAQARIDDPDGEGRRTFIRRYNEQAMAAAEANDILRDNGIDGPLGGIPISVKDLFDIRGETTTAGSIVLRDAPQADADARIIQRLRAAGAIIVGTTNMAEFAFGGVGTNKHYGTPGNPYDRKLIPGGSSSGAAVSVADGMCAVGIGTDTGGSVRIPAAFCGLVGFKPTQARISREGALPLSRTLDSVGPIARCVVDCATVDAIMADKAPVSLEARPLSSVRFAVPETMVCDNLAPDVADAFERACMTLERKGAALIHIPMHEIADAPALNAGFNPTEAYALYHDILAKRGDEFDPRVGKRIVLRGSKTTAAEYLDMIARRAALIEKCTRSMVGFDAFLMPTLPFTAPSLADVAEEQDYLRINGEIVRNTPIVNQIDGCGITIPIASSGAPVGLTIAGVRNTDKTILAIALAAEAALETPKEG